MASRWMGRRRGALLPPGKLWYIEGMKAGFTLPGLCAIVGCAGFLHAQVLQPVLAHVDLSSLVTTGGITYAGYTWTMGGCLELESFGPVLRAGGNCSFDFDFALETGVPCPQDVFSESATIVLGALAPGAYTLTITSWGMPVATNTFTVPTNSTPMLQPLGFAADGSFQMQLNGVANVGYVLQSSTNFVKWTSLSTNYIWPPLKDTSPVLPGLRLYRVQTVTLGPSPGL